MTCFVWITCRLTKKCHFFFLSPKRSHNFNSRMVDAGFVSQTIWNNREMIAETRSYTFVGVVLSWAPYRRPGHCSAHQERLSFLKLCVSLVSVEPKHDSEVSSVTSVFSLTNNCLCATQVLIFHLISSISEFTFFFSVLSICFGSILQQMQTKSPSHCNIGKQKRSQPESCFVLCVK